MLFFLLLIIVIVLAGLFVAGSAIFLSYYIPKELGYPKIGKILAGIVSIFFAYFLTTELFVDELFSTNEAIELLNEQKIILNDDFKIEENKSDWAIGDYYHILRLSISENDKIRLIEEIKSSPGFKDTTYNVTELLYLQEERPIGKRIFQNYETESAYIREYFEEHGEGYAPTFRKISIDKKENLLTFEDIDL